MWKFAAILSLCSLEIALAKSYYGEFEEIELAMPHGKFESSVDDETNTPLKQDFFIR